MRTFLTIVVGILAGVLAFLAMGLTLAWWTAGSAGNLSSTVVSIIDSPGAAAAIGSTLGGNALGSAPPAVQAVLENRQPELAAAAGKALIGASAAVGKVVEVAYTAVSEGIRADLELRPIVQPVLAAMHQVDPTIPSTAEGDMSIAFDGSTVPAAATALRLLSLWWVAVLIALGLIVATAFASRHSGWRRWRAAGIALAVPAVLWALVNAGTLAAPGIPGTDALAQALIESAIAVVRLRGLMIALIAVVIAAAVIALSFVPASKPKATQAAGPAPTPSAEAAG